MAVKGYSAFSKVPTLLKPHSPSDCLVSYLGSSFVESYSSAVMQSVYSTAPADRVTRTLVGEVIPLCRDAVGVFYSSSRLGHPDTRWGSHTPLQKCSRCILQLQQTGPPGHSLEKSYPSAEMQLVYSTAPADRATRTLVGEVIPLCRDAVGVFYSSSRLGHPDTR